MPPMHLLIKPVSGKCNMKCAYCFYTDEMKLRSEKVLEKMTLLTLEKVLEKALKFSEKTCCITFQGGEPTLAGIDYFRAAVEMAKHFNVNRCKLDFALQTNGYGLTEEWAKFFKENNFLLGVSLDGYQELHDRFRRDKKGEGTFERVMTGIRLLQKFQVEVHTLTVVHKETTLHGGRVYQFLKKNHLYRQQYIACLDPLEKQQGQEAYSLTPERYGAFLIDLYRNWYRDLKEGKYIYIRYFDNLLGILGGQMPESCSMGGCCSAQWVIEADGSVYPCDFYALDKWKLGNLKTDSIEQIEKKRGELRFIHMSKQIPKECTYCQWYTLCRNGCRRNCEPVDDEGREKNYFCRSYREFFQYAYSGLVGISRHC